MGDTVIDDGQISSGAVLNAGDHQTVQSSSHNVSAGGKAYLTTINTGGVQTLDFGTADHVVVNPGGVQDVRPGSVATSSILSGPSRQSNDQVFFNGHQTVEGGSAYGTIIHGGYQGVFGQQGYTGEATGSVITNGGIQFVDYGGSVQDTVIGMGGRQILYSTGTERNDYLLVGGSITLANLYTDSANATTSFNQATGLLTVSAGGKSQDIQLAGDYTGKLFVAGSSSYYFGTEVHLLCFAKGTLISTMDGNRQVESLRVGDMLRTARGQSRAIRWIGSVTTMVHETNRPVLVRAGALFDDTPTRDLRVTRGHAFLFGDVLIPIGALVNGLSIVWDRARSVELFHIELDVHDVILANGAAAESYRDAGNGIGFTSGWGVRASPKSLPTCLPVAIKGPIAERTQRRLAERADRMFGAVANPRRCVAANW